MLAGRAAISRASQMSVQHAFSDAQGDAPRRRQGAQGRAEVALQVVYGRGLRVAGPAGQRQRAAPGPDRRGRAQCADARRRPVRLPALRDELG